MRNPILFLVLFFSFSCQSQDNSNQVIKSNYSSQQDSSSLVVKDVDCMHGTSRDSSIAKLKKKYTTHSPIVIHVFVPLCDNEHQGIVPVNKSLGNGLNLTTNLYWGAGFGIKSFYKFRTNWKLLQSHKNIDSNVLERVVFRKYYNNTPVYIVADAYRGDRMKACLVAYFNSLSGNYTNTITIDSVVINVADKADLVVFNGHNGLMDEYVPITKNKSCLAQDAVAIACVSRPYFEPYFKKYKVYPLVTTAHVLAPEAYALNGVIESWLQLKSGEACRFAAGDAYNNIQKCGQRGARNLFRTGFIVKK